MSNTKRLGRYHNIPSDNSNNDNHSSQSHFSELVSLYKNKENSGKPLFDWDKTLFRHKHTSLQRLLANAHGYKGYSINYQDLDIDIYKIELWKLIKDVLRLLDCDIQKLEDQIFPTFIEDDGCDVMLTGTHYSSTANKGNDINNNDQKSNNIQRNESLDKYRSSPQSLVVLSLRSYSGYGYARRYEHVPVQLRDVSSSYFTHKGTLLGMITATFSLSLLMYFSSHVILISYHYM